MDQSKKSSGWSLIIKLTNKEPQGMASDSQASRISEESVMRAQFNPVADNPVRPGQGKRIFSEYTLS